LSCSRTSVPLSFLTTRRSPTSTLFPYTTLFRSSAARHPEGHWQDLHRERMCLDLASLAHPAEGARGGGAGSARARTGLRQGRSRSEEHTSELQSRENLVCRLLLEKKKEKKRKSQ